MHLHFQTLHNWSRNTILNFFSLETVNTVHVDGMELYFICCVIKP